MALRNVYSEGFRKEDECVIINVMETKIEKIDRMQIDETIMETAGEIIKQGGLVAFPTETVYGWERMRLMRRRREKHMRRRADLLIIH